MKNTFKNIREAISSSQLVRLKKEYEPLRKIDMSKHKGQVEKTSMMLKKLKIGILIDLSKENIPWISDIAKSLVLKDKRFAHQVESVNEGFPPTKSKAFMKGLSKTFRKNEDENRHSENYLLLAKAFGSKAEVQKVEAIIKKSKMQGHTSPADNKWMYDHLSQHFKKIGESVEESSIMGLNKSSAEYKAGKEAAKKGIKYDANPHAPGIKRINWSQGHNDFRADNLRKAGKPNYGARGQFEDAQLTENRKYTVVHVDKGKVVVDATSSYEAAKKAAAKWGLKSTSGIDAHLMEEVQEADLSKTQIKMVHDKADELPKQDFIKRYGKDGDAVRFATATNMVKKKLGLERVGDSGSRHIPTRRSDTKHIDFPLPGEGSLNPVYSQNPLKKLLKLGEEVTEDTSREVANVLKKYVTAHPLRFHGGPGLQGGKNKRDFEQLQNLALLDMDKFRKKFNDMKAKRNEDNYNQQAVRDALTKAGLSRHLTD